MNILTRLKSCFENNGEVHDISADFFIKIGHSIICSKCDSVSSSHEFSPSEGLTVLGNILRFKVIKLCRDYSISNTYCEEYEVECEMDITVEQVKQNLEL